MPNHPPSARPLRPAVFFDRDGTLMEEVHYCGDPEKVAAMPGAAGALARLRASGFYNVIITNQSGIGRGYFTVEQFQAVQAELLRQLGGNAIDATYFCADHPDHPTPRRKPQPGMVHEAVADLGIDLARSFFVGDMATDIECGHHAGVRTILVATGYGQRTAACEPTFRARDVVEAIEWIFEQSALS
jgi:D-glycero-D-manno-heptose 1,7-bisphosphate phosphatase